MMNPTFTIKLFEDKSEKTNARGRKVLLVLMEALTQINHLWLIQHPETPKLYKSGVVYKPEAPDLEEWQDIPTCLQRKWGDCEDLAAWLCAELRFQKIAARPQITWHELPDGSMRMHAVVFLPEYNRTLDPSARLGMKRYAEKLATRHRQPQRPAPRQPQRRPLPADYSDPTDHPADRR